MGTVACDLGNWTLIVASANADGRPEVVNNLLGDYSTPSVVYFPPGEDPVVGAEAANMAFAEPDRVVFHWKRHMGTDEVLYHGDDGREWRARDIACLLLDYVKGLVEQRTGEVIRELAVTVPANYTEKQKGETIEAAEQVGLEVVCLPTEPLAAALGNDVHLRGNAITLVYDLGGGTFDVTLLKVQGNLVEVLHTNGDPRLGGQDFNKRIQDRALEAFQAEHGFVPDPKDSADFRADLFSRIEQAKKTLTVRLKAHVMARYDGHILNWKVTRKEVEEWTSDLVKRSMTLVQQTLDESRMDWSEVDVILPVGGGSRMPSVRSALEQASGKNLAEKAEPDYAAAKGGVTASRIELQRQGRKATSNSGTLPVPNFFTREATSRPLGVCVIKNGQTAEQCVLLDAGTPYPSTQVRTFGLVEPNQTEALIQVLEGEAGAPSDECVQLGDFHLAGLPAHPETHTPRIELTFQLDASGLLTATARDLKSGVTSDMSIQYRSDVATQAP